jgi:hypothetical protein
VTSATAFGVFQSKTPPLPPVYVSAIPEQQAVRVMWQPGDTNIRGYYVYRGISGEGLKQTSPFLTDTTFLDSSQELSGKVFYDYAVRAESTSNQLSSYSDTIQVRAEIPTFPQRPRELFATTDESTIRLSWLDMQSLDNNFAIYEIERLIQKQSDKIFRSEENYFNDSTALRGINYTYHVRVIDMFGGASDWSQEATVTIAQPAVHFYPPPGFQAFKGDGVITLRWGGSLQNGLTSYNIYRKTQGSTASRLTSIKANEFEYSDRSVTKGQKYFYYISAVGSGDESERSAPLVIHYE